MGWIEKKRTNIVCRCEKPDSNGGKEFGPGSLWRCDVCRRVYEFKGHEVSYRGEGYDTWQRRQSLEPTE